MKFILTKELGRLLRWLRILGYDAEYFKEERAGSLLVSALREDRVILTRKAQLSYTHATKIINIKSDHLKEQLLQVIDELGLKVNKELMFSRCVVCNVELGPVEKRKIKDKVPEYVYATHKDFFICSNCERVYWQGTHWGNVEEIVDNLAHTRGEG